MKGGKEGISWPSRGSAQQTGPQRASHKRLGIRIYASDVSNGSVMDGHFDWATPDVRAPVVCGRWHLRSTLTSSFGH